MENKPLTADFGQKLLKLTDDILLNGNYIMNWLYEDAKIFLERKRNKYYSALNSQ
jgi:hypothetical protein